MDKVWKDADTPEDRQRMQEIVAWRSGLKDAAPPKRPFNAEDARLASMAKQLKKGQEAKLAKVEVEAFERGMKAMLGPAHDVAMIAMEKVLGSCRLADGSYDPSKADQRDLNMAFKFMAEIMNRGAGKVASKIEGKIDHSHFLKTLAEEGELD